VSDVISRETRVLMRASSESQNFTWQFADSLLASGRLPAKTAVVQRSSTVSSAPPKPRKNIGVRLESHWVDAMERYTQETGLTTSTVIRKALSDLFRKEGVKLNA
jgi:hypothetical protein